MPALEETLVRANRPRPDDRWDAELDRVEWIELPESRLPVDGLVWAILAAFASCMLAAIL